MLNRLARAKRAKTQLQWATWVALALAVALLMLFLEFDRPLATLSI